MTGYFQPIHFGLCLIAELRRVKRRPQDYRPIIKTPSQQPFETVKTGLIFFYQR